MNENEESIINVLVIETVNKENIEWGLSFTDHNPLSEDYFPMQDEETAFRLHEYLLAL